MKTNKIAIVLGGSNPHIALIEKLKERKYYTILIDYLENPPAKNIADKHIQESTIDKEKVLEIARGFQVDIVISACIDQAIVTACYVSEVLGLPSLYNYKTSLAVTNKGLMKQRMIENNIPTSRFVFINNIEDFKVSGLKFPVMVKPADSWGSTGVKKANNINELEKYLSEALKISRTDKAIVEEFKEGREVSLYCFVKDRKAHIIMMSERYNIIEGEQKSIKCYATLSPVKFSETVNQKIQQVANQIAKSFELENTPLHIQIFINKGEVNVIEIGARVAAGLSYRTIQMNTGFDMLSATIDLYCNKSFEIEYNQKDSLIAVHLIYSYPGVFNNFAINKQIIEKGIIEEYYLYKQKGMDIGDDMSNRTRIGAFIVKANSTNELAEKIKIAMDNMEVYDIDNKPIMKRDLQLEIG
jgi:biotin carboxylase